MSNKSHRTEIEFPDYSEFLTQSQQIRREAEVARSIYVHKLVSKAAQAISIKLHRIGELFAFTQRMNQDARL